MIVFALPYTLAFTLGHPLRAVHHGALGIQWMGGLGLAILLSARAASNDRRPGKHERLSLASIPTSAYFIGMVLGTAPSLLLYHVSTASAHSIALSLAHNPNTFGWVSALGLIICSTLFAAWVSHKKTAEFL